MEHKAVKYLYSREKRDQTNGVNPKKCYTFYYKDEDEYKRKLEEIKEKQRIENENYIPKPIIKEDPLPSIEGLPSFVLEKDKPGSGDSFAILASSKSGKSYIMREINHQHFGKKFINLVFSPNIHAAVYAAFNGIKFNKFNKDCEALIRNLKIINSRTKNKFRFMINIDDIIDSKYSKILNELFLTLRNSQFSCCINLQYPMLLSKQARSNTSHLIFGRFNNYESIEQVVKIFLRGHFRRMGIKTLDDMYDFYNKLTMDYNFLYLDVKKNKLSRFKLNLN